MTRLPKPTWKPPVIGHIDGNIFAVLAAATIVLRREGKRDYLAEMKDRVMTEATSYSDALAIIQEYVELRPM